MSTVTTAADRTLDPKLRSWVETANTPACDFPVQNLPLGVFTRSDAKEPRIGIAIGDSVLDLRACAEAGLLDDVDEPLRLIAGRRTLNELMRLGPRSWRSLRRAAGDMLKHDGDRAGAVQAKGAAVLIDQADTTPCVPATIGDYTDFYASVHHATNVGSMFRPDNPLLPNYKHLPVGYHGRSSSIVVTGTPVRRPCGQVRSDGDDLPSYGPCRLLDYELEMGFFVGPGNDLGTPISMRDADEHIFGLVIVNDWSARDIQKWEYQPLGPFNAKNFATTLSPWVVTLDALAPFRVAGPRRGPEDPPIMEYLAPARDLGLDITVEVRLASEQMTRAGIDPMLVSRGSFAEMFWTIGQMLVHHSSTGCNMKPGDLLATGTISGPEETARGCLLERTWRGQHPIELPDGTDRKFLANGDEVIISAFCEREGATRIGFGTCRGTILPAVRS